MNTTTTKIPARVIGKCGQGHAVNVAADEVRAGWISCPCGSRAVAKFMNVSHKEDAKCGLRCTSSLGPTCSCSCDGANHGSDLRF